MALSATPVDPRYATGINEHPLYRVDFWTGDSSSDEWRIEGAKDLHEVLDWATARAEGRSIVIYVEIVSERGRLARILWKEPI
ncbi:MAG TPA: hypothetical protein VF477_12510 [Mycobacterium sp.]